MKKFAFQAILLVIVIAVALFFYKTNPSLSGLPFVSRSSNVRQIQIGNALLKVEVADTQEKRSKGLGDRQALGPDEGMLFVFDNDGQHPFWMKGLKFPLDLIWINKDKVVDISENAQPQASGQADELLPIYQAKGPADKVLEVNAGLVQRFGIQVGDLIKIE